LKILVTPGRSLHGIVKLPGDKSLSHRAALFSALAEGKSEIRNFLVSGVTDAMLCCLAALGVSYHLEETTLVVEGVGLHGFERPSSPLDCGNSATTLRLLAGALSESGTEAILTGSPGLLRRPMDRIVEPLRQMKVPISTSPKGTAPLKLIARKTGSKLSSLNYELPVASAQVKSCLLLAALDAEGISMISEPGPSRDHTERMLAGMGVKIITASRKVTVHPTDRLNPLEIQLPGDFSSAAFLIVAGLVTSDSEVVIKDVGLNPTRVGLLDVLQSMGAEIEIKVRPDQAGESIGDLHVRSSRLNKSIVSGNLVVRMIDEFPIFAVAAAYAQGESIVSEAVELRYKESDRITAMCQELSSVGGIVNETQDGFRIKGKKLQGGKIVDPRGDHRLAMALAVAGLASEEAITINQAEILSESFPEFLTILQALGADIQICSDEPEDVNTTG
jgi:3-phosphoshikimate 1-carboxyvinyltransferase